MNTTVFVTNNPLPTIQAGGHTLTLDIAKQLDEVVLGLRSDFALIQNAFKVFQPIARVRATGLPGIEVIILRSNTLTRLRIQSSYGIDERAIDQEDRDRHNALQDLAGKAQDLPLAVLPATTTITQ